MVWVNSEQELQDLISAAVKQGIRTIPIIDAGLTEFHGADYWQMGVRFSLRGPVTAGQLEG